MKKFVEFDKLALNHKKSLSILVIGGVETGKSSTINALLNDKIADINQNGEQSTKKCQISMAIKS